MVKSVQVGDRLGIYWPLDRSYYPCVVVALYDNDAHQVHVHYDDGDMEDLDLTQHDFFLWKGDLAEDDKNNKKKPRLSEIAHRIEHSLRKASYAKLQLLQQQEEPTTAAEPTATTTTTTRSGGSSSSGVRQETRDKGDNRRQKKARTTERSATPPKTGDEKERPKNYYSVRGPDGRFTRVPIHDVEVNITKAAACKPSQTAPLAAVGSSILTNAV